MDNMCGFWPKKVNYWEQSYWKSLSLIILFILSHCLQRPDIHFFMICSRLSTMEPELHKWSHAKQKTPGECTHQATCHQERAGTSHINYLQRQGCRDAATFKQASQCCLSTVTFYLLSLSLAWCFSLFSTTDISLFLAHITQWIQLPATKKVWDVLLQRKKTNEKTLSTKTTTKEIFQFSLLSTCERYM